MSNKSILRNLRDSLPEPVGQIFSNYLRNKIIRNKLYIDMQRTLKKRANMEHIEIEKYQLKKLKEVLIFANQNVPYYSATFKKVGFKPKKFNSFSQMKELPILTKKTLSEKYEDLISTKNVKGGYYEAATGGTQGRPTQFLLDANSLILENAFINYFRSKIGYSHNDLIATFRGIEFGRKFFRFNPMFGEYIFSPFQLSGDTINEYLDKMNKIKPVFLNGYISSIYFFAKLLERKKLSLKSPLKGIFLISENPDYQKREFLEKFFQAKTLSFYGQSERVAIAEESKNWLYNFDPFYGYTELLSAPNGKKRIVATGFLSKTMPLIRYDTEDIARATNGQIKITGRWNAHECLVGKSGEQIPPSALNFHKKLSASIVTYQFIQKQKGKAILRLVGENIPVNEISRIKKQLTEKCKNSIDFKVETHKKAILTARGKFRIILNEFKN